MYIYGKGIRDTHTVLARSLAFVAALLSTRVGTAYDIPSLPPNAYKDEWQGWNNWLTGTKPTAEQLHLVRNPVRRPIRSRRSIQDRDKKDHETEIGPMGVRSLKGVRDVLDRVIRSIIREEERGKSERERAQWSAAFYKKSPVKV